MLCNKRKLDGFTLSELSISIAIISLIIAGVATGVGLMKQSTTRGLIAEMSNIKAAVYNFRLQYDAYPGDFNNASGYWLSSTCAAGSVTSGCNGNDDGNISNVGTAGDETHRVFQHLSLAGFIPGVRNGTLSAADQFQSEYVTNGVYVLRMTTPWTGAASGFNANTIELGAYNGNYSGSSILVPMDAYNIDLKLDDGLANSGTIYGLNGESAPATCSYDFTTTGGASAYQYTQTAVCCRMHYWVQ